MQKCFPLEGCGLLIGPIDENNMPMGEIKRFWPTKNAAASALIYEIDSIDQLKASRYCDENNLEIVGVVHSHTHSKAYPSPTDIKLSIDPNWIYSIVSLQEKDIVMNSYQIDKSSNEIVKVNCNIV